MENQNLYNSYVSDDDKCPNCGALKMFSALVCPSCGMNYADSANARRIAAMEANKAKEEEKKAFDPNASFAKFKSSLEKKDTEETNPVYSGNSFEHDDENTEKIEDHSMYSGNEISSTDSLSEKEELNKIEDADPITKRLSELSNQNGGMYGERKYRVNENPVDLADQDDNTGSVRPGVYIPGSNNSSNHGAGKYGNTGTYGAGNAYNTGNSYSKPSGTEASGKASGNSARQYGDVVSNRYEEYKTGYGGTSSQDMYSSPYSRGAFDVVPEKKPSVLKKILPLVFLLAVILTVGYFVMRYTNSDKNSNGAAYEKGTVEGGYYVNNWAEIKFKFDNGMLDYTSKPEIDLEGTKLNMESSLKEKNAEIDVNMVAAYKVPVDNGREVMVPAVIIYTITDNSFKAKLFGINEDEFFNDDNLGNAVMPDNTYLRRENDMLLGEQPFRTYCLSASDGKGTKISIYVCVKAIGNRMVFMAIYDIPKVIEINSIKKHFEKWQ